MTVFGVGGTLETKYAQLVVSEFAKASTVAEEIISSVRTAQAFGTQEKLANLYDENLISAQKMGYKQQLTAAVMLSTMFFSVYAFYGLGFCTSRVRI
jgi:ATP-binding cassette subfamily B (MDR/TAP) protein 1